MPHLSVPGATIYYEADGPAGAPAVLLIHAGVATLRMWDALMPRLASDHYVVRFDTRGFGQTESENVEYTDRGDARDVLDHLGVASALVIGASRGGGIALDLALESPERVDGVVTIGSAPSGFPWPELTAAETLLAERLDKLEAAHDWHALARAESEFWTIGPTRSAADLDPAFVELAYEVNRPNAAHGDEQPVNLPLEPPAYERLKDLSLPALVTVGDRDVSACILEWEYLVDAIPDAEGHVFENAAHLPSLEHPEAFADTLLAWMLRHDL